MTNIRKLLRAVSFIAVLLLNQPITWAQGFGDFVKGEFSNCAIKTNPFISTGSPANDYAPGFKVFPSCILPTKPPTKESFVLRGSAQLGRALGFFGFSAVTGLGASDEMTVEANDTLVLNPPHGFTGTSVKIDLVQTYQLEIHGVIGSNRGSATACFKWTGRQTPICFPKVTDGFVEEGVTFSPIVVNKTNLGFRLNLELTGFSAVATVAGNQVSADVEIGSPTITVPENWTFRWLSGEP
jgi:hypothetical protein